MSPQHNRGGRPGAARPRGWPTEHPLPRDTAAAVATSAGSCLNVGLWLDHFAGFVEANGVLSVSGASKQRQGVPGDLSGLGGLARSHLARWQALAAACGGRPFRLYTASRLIVGLGAKGVLETAITLHRVYGLPLIPGSALKGLARVDALFELAAALGVRALTLEEYWKHTAARNAGQAAPTPLGLLETLLDSPLQDGTPDERRALQVKLDALRAACLGAPVAAMEWQAFCAHPGVADFRSWFGCQGQAGRVIFFDAAPGGAPGFALDVMNPHFPKYYSAPKGKPVPPSDDQDPVPVYFLTVEQGSPFHFAVAPRRRGDAVDQAAADAVRVRLASALKTLGIGAKTSAGYGLFADQRQPAGFGDGVPEPNVPRPSDRTIKPSAAPPPQAPAPSESDEPSDTAKAILARMKQEAERREARDRNRGRRGQNS